MELNTQKIIRYSTSLFKRYNFKKPRYESLLILSKVVKKDLLEILTNKSIKINEKKNKKFLNKVYQRIKNKPLSRISGIKEFYSREFFINKFVLDPRPETEILVDVIKKLKIVNKKKVKILDLGTGTSCLLITLVLEFKKKVKGVGVDNSVEALKVAKKNIEKFNLCEHINLIHSNWFSKIRDNFDIIISNPPYIPSNEINYLDDEVKNFDPRNALDGGKSGINCYKIIAEKIDNFLKPDGFICLEVGNNQIKKVEYIFKIYGFKKIFKQKDYMNHERVIVFKKNRI